MDEIEGLDILIKQRNDRRRFVRMISWGRPTDGSSKQSDIVDERPRVDDEVSSGDEEFFSADEGSDVSEEEEMEEDEEIESDSEEEPINLSERKKPSKRKRKRLKQLLKSLEETTPIETEQFSLLSFFSKDYQTCQSKQSIGRESDIEVATLVQREVPSLVELCLKNCQNLEQRQHLPPGIRRIMSVFRYEESLRRLQINWLHRSLGELEKGCTQDYKDGVCSHFCQVRELKKSNMETRSYVPVTYCREMVVFPLVWPFFSSKVKHFYPRNTTLYDNGLEAMPNMIDLMLPVTIGMGSKSKWKKQNPNKSNEDENLATALSIIQKVLQKRYPKYTQFMYGLAEGYALWVRGDVENAERAFSLLLSRRTVKEVVKSLIRNEIGRMYLMFGDLVKASQYFLEAAVDGEEEEERHATDQALALIALQSDTGFMTASKGQESWAAWMALIYRKTSFIPVQGLANLAVESAVRVFGGHVVDTKLTSRWHVDVLERLNQITYMAPNARLAKALVYAMLGEEGESKETYTNYLSSVGPAFYEPQKSSYQSSYVFQSVLDQMKDRVRPISPIKLTWRTQMCYPSFCYEAAECAYHSKPTDDCSLHLNLHLCDEGYLTGDMAMHIPPIRGVYLDPYTGRICLPHVPLKASPWKDLTVHQQHHVSFSHRETFRLPRILRVVDNEKCIVDFCISSDKNGCNQSTSLTWIGADGTRMTLDLKKMIKIEAKKELEDMLNTMRSKEGEKWVNERLDILNLFMERGWLISYHRVSNYAGHLERMKQWEQEKKKRKEKEKQEEFKPSKHGKGKKPTRLTKPSPGPMDKFKLVLDTFYTYGETVCLLFKLDNTGTSSRDSTLIVIANCSSIDTFKAPKISLNNYYLVSRFIWYNSCYVMTTLLEPCQGHTQIRHFPHAKAFILHGHHDDKNGLSVFDADGTLTNFARPGTITELEYYIIGTHCYFIAKVNDVIGIERRSFDCFEEEGDFRGLADVSAIHQVEDIFIVKMALGVCLFNTLSMELFIINNATDSFTFPLESESTIIMGEDLDVTTFTSRRKRSGTRHRGEVVQIAMGVRSRVFILEVPFDGKSCQYASQVDVVLQVEVPGVPREICFVSYEAGFIVAASLNEELDVDDHRNHVYQFGMDGHLIGILPFLGEGPHRFTSIYLEESKEHSHLGEDAGKPGWHVFFVDGHGALACFNASLTEED